EDDKQRVVGNGPAREAAPAAANGNGYTGAAPEADRRHHVRDAHAPRDQRRAAVDRAVPDLPALVVRRVARRDDLAAEGGLQLRERSLVERELFGDDRHARSVP